MIKNHKWKALISSVIILLPMVFGLIIWDKLPVNMTSHWGADGTADGQSPKTFVVFALPLILLALHWLMLLIETIIEKRQPPKNGKIVGIIYGVIPATSLVVNAATYSIALEKDWNVFAMIAGLIGVLFMAIGNYLPKTTRNRTMGIKLPWTLENDENWQKTHRLGGKLWFWCGMIMLAAALLPGKATVIVMLVSIAVSVLVPTIYSYTIYKAHKALGIEYEPIAKTKGGRIASRIVTILVILLLVGVAILMFTGGISVELNEDTFEIKASYYEDLTVRYEAIDSVEYRDDLDVGVRTMGFGSARLSMGTFENDEFGRYTLYAYTGAESYVVLRQGEKVLVIGAKTATETMSIYNSLIAKVQP